MEAALTDCIERIRAAADAAAPRPLTLPAPMRVVVRAGTGSDSIWSMLRVAGRAPPALETLA